LARHMLYVRSLATVESEQEFPRSQRSTTMVGKNAKLVAKIVVLAAVMIGTFVAASVQSVPSADGGPLILCPPRASNCQSTLPTLRS